MCAQHWHHQCHATSSASASGVALELKQSVLTAFLELNGELQRAREHSRAGFESSELDL